MRYFNPETMTEVLPGIHDMTGVIPLPDDCWFFTATEMPEGKQLAVDESGVPVLVDLPAADKE
ncbi:hypothetical protein [Lelliottia amnigena]|uniref:Uncharacterized protein n=2 Tax=Lelliottia amnigena TaxID=61646 RepID=A0ABU7UAN3_LELAM